MHLYPAIIAKYVKYKCIYKAVNISSAIVFIPKLYINCVQIVGKVAEYEFATQANVLNDIYIRI